MTKPIAKSLHLGKLTPWPTNIDFMFTRAIPEPNTGCWLWDGGLTTHGYGQLIIGGKRWGAHRLAFTLENGTIPPGMYVCHACDNRLCVNPGHLFLGTHNDNMKDMVKKGRSSRMGRPRSAFCINGHDLSVTRVIRPSGSSECRLCRKEKAKKRGRKRN